MAVDHSINVGVRLGTSLGRLSPAAGAELMQMMRSLALSLREFVLRVWPVDTATSLQEWEIRSTALRLIVSNPVDYAEYVHRAGEDALVHEEIRDHAESLVADALPDMRRIVDEDTGPPLQIQVTPPPLPPISNFLLDRLFHAKAAAFLRVGGRERNRQLRRDQIRQRISNRRPVARPIGR